MDHETHLVRTLAGSTTRTETAMTNLQNKIRTVLDGIDRTELDGGWWETSTGAEFGASQIPVIEDLIRQELLAFSVKYYGFSSSHHENVKEYLGK